MLELCRILPIAMFWRRSHKSRHRIGHIRPLSLLTLSAPLGSSHNHDLFPPRAATTMAKTRSFPFMDPSLWNHFPPRLRSSILPTPFSFVSLALSLTFLLELKCTESASARGTP